MRGRGRGRQGGGVAMPSRAAAPRRPGRGRRGGGSVASFLAPHTGRQAGRIANAEAGNEFNPEIRNLREQAKGSRARERDLGSWYRQLAGDYQGAAAAGSAALQSVEDTTSKQLAEAGDRSSADQARLAKQDESFAALVGGPQDTQGLSKIAQAGAAAARARVALNQPVAAEQANFVGRVGEEGAAARLQGISARQAERTRRMTLKDETAAKQREKRSARVANKEKIREADRGFSMEGKKLTLEEQEAATARQQALATAALARIKAAHETQQDAIANRQAQERIGISRKNARTSARSPRATAKHYAHENKGGMTAAERNSQREHRHDAMSEAKSLLASEAPPKNAAEWAKFEAHLVELMGGSYGAEIARAVAKLRKQVGYNRRKAAARRAVRSVTSPFG